MVVWPIELQLSSPSPLLCCSGCCPELWGYGVPCRTAIAIFVVPTPGGTVNNITAALQQTAARTALGKRDTNEVVTPIQSIRSHHYMHGWSKHLVTAQGDADVVTDARGDSQPGTDARKHILAGHGCHPNDALS